MKPIKLNQKQLRSIVNEELSRAKRLSEADKGFRLTDVSFSVGEDPDLDKTILALAEAIVSFVTGIAEKEDLIGPGSYDVLDEAFREAESAVRGRVYDVVKSTLKKLSQGPR